jgi:hypothetical protein
LAIQVRHRNAVICLAGPGSGCERSSRSPVFQAKSDWPGARFFKGISATFAVTEEDAAGGHRQTGRIGPFHYIVHNCTSLGKAKSGPVPEKWSVQVVSSQPKSGVRLACKTESRQAAEEGERMVGESKLTL